MTGAVVDGCAGPGGWDLAARSLGLDPLGVEFDDAACATRAAAGLRTVQADVTVIDPAELGDVWGLIFSPPCQAFSMAGKGAGRAAIKAYRDEIGLMARGGSVRTLAERRADLDEACGDDRAHVVLEPLRWALALRPEWIALEQVAPVLPLWEAMAEALRAHGYRTWTGILSAERFGVPQTRQRAILMASRSRQPVEPPATHARYVPGRVKAKQEESLFDAPEPERIVLPEDRGLLPWVSMAEALGWGMTARPYPVVAGGTSGGPDMEHVGGSQARAAIYAEQEAGRWSGEWTDFERSTPNGSRPDGEWVPEDPERWHYRAGSHENATRRPVDEPAPTLHFGHDTAGDEWTTGDGPRPRRDAPGPDAEVQYRRGGERLDESTPVSAPSSAVTSRFDRWQVVDAGCTRSGGQPEGGRARGEDEPAAPVTSRADQLERRSHYDSRQQKDGRSGEPNRQRAVDEPAPTIAGESRNDSWVSECPATTVAGDPRVFPPGHKLNADDEAAGRDAQQRSGAGMASGADGAKAVRVTEAEASVLQGFPSDYPWQGTRTARYRQIGDAIPPPLARAILEGLIG